MRMFAEACFTPKVKLQLTQLVTAYHMANNAFGATFISDRLVRTENAHLRFYLLDSPLATRLFHILLPERDYTPFAVRTFIRFSVQAIRDADLAHGRDWGLPE